MITKVGTTTILDSGAGDSYLVAAGITTLETTTAASGESFTGGASLTSVTNYGKGESFNFTQGNIKFVDDGTGTSFVAGNGNANISTTNGGARIVLGNGTQTVSLRGNGNAFSMGNTTTGTSTITTYGGANQVIAGNGTIVYNEDGAGDQVILGSGSDTVYIGRAATAPTSDVLQLGNGTTNTIWTYASGNTINGGTGMTFLDEESTGNTVVANAAGGSITFGGAFKLSGGDHLDLTQLLAGEGGVNAGNVASFITESMNGSTLMLAVKGLNGTENVTMTAAGSQTLSTLISDHFLVLPTS